MYFYPKHNVWTSVKHHTSNPDRLCQVPLDQNKHQALCVFAEAVPSRVSLMSFLSFFFFSFFLPAASPQRSKDRRVHQWVLWRLLCWQPSRHPQPTWLCFQSQWPSQEDGCNSHTGLQVNPQPRFKSSVQIQRHVWTLAGNTFNQTIEKCHFYSKLVVVVVVIVLLIFHILSIQPDGPILACV